MKTAFEYLEPLLLSVERGGQQKTKIILATVKGDIHDIGKNIVGLMLKNYGFEVIDLGKDVPTETILDAAARENGKIIGLSALMTTTMVEMRAIIALARQRKPGCEIHGRRGRHHAGICRRNSGRRLRQGQYRHGQAGPGIGC